MGEEVYVEALQALRQATVEYVNVLEKNMNVLQKAARVCAAALAPDDVSRNYIDRLNESLRRLDQTIDIAERNFHEIEEVIWLHTPLAGPGD